MSRDACEPHPIDAPGTDERSWAAWPWLSTLPRAGLARLAHYRDADFTAEVYTRAGDDLESVAQIGGIV